MRLISYDQLPRSLTYRQFSLLHRLMSDSIDQLVLRIILEPVSSGTRGPVSFLVANEYHG